MKIAMTKVNQMKNKPMDMQWMRENYLFLLVPTLVLMVSYGSGAGSDGFIWKITDQINAVREKAPKTWDMINGRKTYLDYGQYAKFRGKILTNN